MDIHQKVVRGTFIKRPNRFQAYVILDGEELLVAVPNTGRCKEILTEGCTVLLREGLNPKRKTKYDLIAGYKGDKLINIDSQAPNKVVEEALKLGKIDILKKYTLVEREKFFGKSRFDFRLTNSQNDIYFLEVKGVTLEEDGHTKFPDAPTERGARHLLELVEARKQGWGAGVLFLIQMDGVTSFSPYDKMDKNFGDALRYAVENGVDIYAYQCSIGEKMLTLDKRVPIFLEEHLKS